MCTNCSGGQHLHRPWHRRHRWYLWQSAHSYVPHSYCSSVWCLWSRRCFATSRAMIADKSVHSSVRGFYFWDRLWINKNGMSIKLQIRSRQMTGWYLFCAWTYPVLPDPTIWLRVSDIHGECWKWFHGPSLLWTRTTTMMGQHHSSRPNCHRPVLLWAMQLAELAKRFTTQTYIVCICVHSVFINVTCAKNIPMQCTMWWWWSRHHHVIICVTSQIQIVHWLWGYRNIVLGKHSVNCSLFR